MAVKVYFNSKEYNKLLKKIDKYEEAPKVLEKEMKSTMTKAGARARTRFKSANAPSRFGINPSGINTKKEGDDKKPAYSLNAGNRQTGRFYAYVEWGTRGRFNESNLNDVQEVFGKEKGKQYAKMYMKNPLIKATNLKANPFFFNSFREAMKGFGKRVLSKLGK